MIGRLLITFLILIGCVGASSLSQLSVSSNQVYQNTNSTNPLIIYATGDGGQQLGYVGASSGNVILVSNSTIVLSGVIGATLTYKDTITLVVPPNWYYEFIYSGNDLFYGEYSSVTITKTNSNIVLPFVSDTMFSNIIVAIIGIIFLFLYNQEKDNIFKLLFLILGFLFIGGAFLINSQLVSSAYNQTTGITTYNYSSANTTPLAIGIFCILLLILGMLFVRKFRNG